MNIMVRAAKKEDASSLANIIVESCGSIYSIYLLEEIWGKGLSSKLMDQTIEILKREGCKKISLWVYEENIRARKFYEKHGFAFDGSEKYSRFSNKPLELRYIKYLQHL